MIAPGSFPDAAGPPWQDLAGLPAVAQALDEARALVDRVLVHRVVGRQGSRAAALAAEAALRGARASAALDGVEVPLEAVRAGEAADPVLAGALRVNAELPRLRTVWHSSPRQALARLHLLAAAGLGPSDLLGRPVDADAATALGRVSALATGSDPAVPALLVAALVHGELAVGQVFGAGNGVVARAASRLVLADRGLDPDLLCMPDVGHLALGDYGSALAAYADGDRARWVQHCAAAAAYGAREALAVAQAMVRG